MMSIRRRIAWALVLVLLMVENAAANVGPAPAAVFAPVLMVLFLIVLSLVGGAYPILQRLDPSRNRWWRIAMRWAGAILFVSSALFLPLFFDGFGAIAPLLVVLTLWILSLLRGVQMIRWAKQTRSSDPTPIHLTTANPWRLAPAGVSLIVLPILSILALAALLPATGRPKVDRAASDAKTAVTQAIVYASDHRVYPTSPKVLRDAGYANIWDTDPWGKDWVLSPVLTQGGKPKAGEDVYVYSKGPCGTGTYVPGGPADTGKCGAVGFSSIYGAFRGREE